MLRITVVIALTVMTAGCMGGRMEPTMTSGEAMSSVSRCPPTASGRMGLPSRHLRTTSTWAVRQTSESPAPARRRRSLLTRSRDGTARSAPGRPGMPALDGSRRPGRECYGDRPGGE